MAQSTLTHGPTLVGQAVIIRRNGFTFQGMVRSAGPVEADGHVDLMLDLHAGGRTGFCLTAESIVVADVHGHNQ
jgi:hypothetical protein